MLLVKQQDYNPVSVLYVLYAVNMLQSFGKYLLSFVYDKWL